MCLLTLVALSFKLKFIKSPTQPPSNIEEESISKSVSTLFCYILLIEFDWLCILYCASRTDCIALYVDRTAGSQACSHNEF